MLIFGKTVKQVMSKAVERPTMLRLERFWYNQQIMAIGLMSVLIGFSISTIESMIQTRTEVVGWG